MSEVKQERESVLVEAQGLVHGGRNKEYGSPREFYIRTAKIWEAILGFPVTPEQVGLCMCGFKLSRQIAKPKRDNMVDLAGYAETVQWNNDEAEAEAELEE